MARTDLEAASGGRTREAYAGALDELCRDVAGGRALSRALPQRLCL